MFARAPATGSPSSRRRSTRTASSARSAPRPRCRPADALEALEGALALWRGPAYGDLGASEFAQAEVRRLEDLRAKAQAAHARALVDLGRPLEAIPVLRRLLEDEPLGEELTRTLMLALYAGGRQVEALAAYRELAARLRELGLQPGEPVRALERRILEQDPRPGGAP